MSLASVIINNYNYADFVTRSVESSLSQAGADVEVIVVDDGSTDGSRTVLDRYRDRVTVILQENAGQAAAINAGVRASHGEFLCFLDSDDWWARDKVAAVTAALRADPAAVLAYHRLQPSLVGGEPILKPIPRTLCAGDLSARMGASGGWWPFPMTSALTVRRSAWEEAGPIPEELRISADAWLVGIYPFLGRVAALPEALGFYRLHDNNNWSRAVDSPAILQRRMKHWATTVRLTNRFLETRGASRRLQLEDHLPYQLADARLNGAGPRRRLDLALHGLRFRGEPNLARRLRDVVRDVPALPRQGKRLTATPGNN